MARFQLQAECVSDVEQLKTVLLGAGIAFMEWILHPLPELDSRIAKDASALPDVAVLDRRDRMANRLEREVAREDQNDVMLETVSEIESYSGVRTYKPAPEAN